MYSRCIFTYRAKHQAFSSRFEPFSNGFLIWTPIPSPTPIKFHYRNVRTMSTPCPIIIVAQTHRERKNDKKIHEIGMICLWDIILLLFRIRMSQIACLTICCWWFGVRFCVCKCGGASFFGVVVAIGILSGSTRWVLNLSVGALAIRNYGGVIEFNASTLDTVWFRPRRPLFFSTSTWGSMCDILCG